LIFYFIDDTIWAMDNLKSPNSPIIDPISPNQAIFLGLEEDLYTNLPLSEDKKSSFQEEIRRLKEKIRALEEELAQNKVQTARTQVKCSYLKLENDDLRHLLEFSQPNSQSSTQFFPNSEYENLKKEHERLKCFMAGYQRRIEDLETALAAAAKVNEELNKKLGKPRPNSKNSGLSSALDVTKPGKDDGGKDSQERSGRSPKVVKKAIHLISALLLQMMSPMK
jgi:uncharacterized coiled-coil protein SlyX